MIGKHAANCLVEAHGVDLQGGDSPLEDILVLLWAGRNSWYQVL
jgi:hypothetical protein